MFHPFHKHIKNKEYVNRPQLFQRNNANHHDRLNRNTFSFRMILVITSRNQILDPDYKKQVSAATHNEKLSPWGITPQR